MKRSFPRTGLLVALLALSAGAAAQLQLGNIEMKGGASISAGYTASYGDYNTNSSHGFNLGGSGAFDGSYYNPKFLSFHLQPYYNQSRANSEFQSVSDSSGILSSAQIFSGSNFPGSISFSKTYNSLSTFGTSAGANLASSGNGQGFSIGWSALLPNKPTFSVAYSRGSGSGDVLGSGQEAENDNHTLNLRSTYTIAGFRMRGGYLMAGQHSRTPGFLVGEKEIESENNHNTLSFSADHNVPLHGNFYTNLSRSHFQSFYQGVSEGTNIVDDVNGGVTLNPASKLSLNFYGTYNDNLFAAFRQEISPNGIAPPINLGGGSHSFTLSGGAGYSLLDHVAVSANVTHVEQFYFGGSHETTYFSGTIHGNYRKPLLGMLTWSVSGVDNANQEGNSNLGFASSVNLVRRINVWELGANFEYDQNVQTTIVGYTSSAYRWRGQASRKFAGRWYWNGTIGGMHSVFSQVQGSGNRSESVSTGIGNGRWSFSGNYSQSAGRSILTSNGLQPVPLPIPGVPLENVVLFDATSYGISATAAPKRGLLAIYTYQKARSGTASLLANSTNDTTYVTARIQYQLRRLSVLAGYSRLSQGISAANLAPVNVDSYYIGINRWFNIF